MKCTRCGWTVNGHPIFHQNVFFLLTDTGSDITWAKLDELHYLSNVVKESTRLYPAVPILGRTSGQDDILAGYHIPTNTHVLIGIGDIHRSEKYWSDPNTFKPERFDNLSKCLNLQYQLFFWWYEKRKIKYLLLTLNWALKKAVYETYILEKTHRNVYLSYWGISWSSWRIICNKLVPARLSQKKPCIRELISSGLCSVAYIRESFWWFNRTLQN